MSKEMKRLLAGDHPRIIHGSWDAIKEILVEQQLITAGDDESNNSALELKGFMRAYRCLEKFHLDGADQIQKENNKSNP